jgi:hypothetical protein
MFGFGITGLGPARRIKMPCESAKSDGEEQVSNLDPELIEQEVAGRP